MSSNLYGPLLIAVITVILFWLKSRADAFNETRKLKITEYDKRLTLLGDLIGKVRRIMILAEKMNRRLSTELSPEPFFGSAYRTWKEPVLPEIAIITEDFRSLASDMTASAEVYGLIKSRHSFDNDELSEGLNLWAMSLEKDVRTNPEFDAWSHEVKAIGSLRQCVRHELKRKERLLEATVRPIWHTWNVKSLSEWVDDLRKSKRNAATLHALRGRPNYWRRIFVDEYQEEQRKRETGPRPPDMISSVLDEPVASVKLEAGQSNGQPQS